MISVIIPAYNEEEYIEQTIQSVKEQNYQNYELIVVLDGCTDKTFQKVKDKVNQIINLKERQGQAVARNKGAEKAKGEILVFLDADTKLQKNNLEKISNTQNKWIVGTCKFKPNHNKLKHILVYSIKNIFLCPFGVSNGIIFCRKSDFDLVNGFDEKMNIGEDKNLIKKLKKYGKFKLLNTNVINSTRRFDKIGYLKSAVYKIKEKIKPSNKLYEVAR